MADLVADVSCSSISYKMDRLERRKKALILLALADIHEERKKKRKSCWVKPWRDENRRKSMSCHHRLMQELRLLDSESYRGYIRMDTNTFQSILKKIEPVISKQYTYLRNPISSAESLTLRFLATGETFRSLEYQFRIAHNTISEFIPEVLEAICNAYKDEYLKMPCTQKEWLEIAYEFQEMWQFAQCLGVIDGKHVRISCPKNSDSSYYNYKGFYSIVMMAVVRADLSFLYVDAGTNGRQNDSSIWNATSLKQAIDKNMLNFPPDKPLSEGRQLSPYVFVCDEGIGMSRRVMRPYSCKNLDTEKSTFNYRLSRARRVSEYAFGILSSVWREYFQMLFC